MKSQELKAMKSQELKFTNQLTIVLGVDFL
jgi:hypothetical protein